MGTWDLYLGTLVYFVSSLGGVAIVKFLNYHFCFSSWLVLALLSRATWILALPLACLLLQGGEGFKRIFIERLSRKQLGIYVVIAVGLAVVESFNAVSLSVVPGNLYALIKGSDVFWSMLLSWGVLGKTYTRTQVAGVTIVLLAIATVFGMGTPTASNAAQQQATEQAMQAAHIPNATAAAALCLVAALLNSLIAVITEATLKQTLRAEQERLALTSCIRKQQLAPSKLALSNEYAMWTSFFAFVLLTSTAAMTGQVSQVLVETGRLSCDEDDSNRVDDGTFAPSRQSIILWTLSLLCVTVSRFAERLCKHWICVRDSAMTFSLVQAVRRLSGVFVLAALFGEAFPLSMVVGSMLASFGFALHTYGALQLVDGHTSVGHKEGDYQLVSLSPAEVDEEDEKLERRKS